MHRLIRLRAAIGIITLLLLPPAYAAGLPNQVTLVPDASVAANPVNAPQAFTVTTGGNYTVTLTDLVAPIPLSSLSVAITTASGPAQKVTLPIQSSATGAYSATTTLTLAAGSYFAQVLASANQPGGTFSVVVTPVTPAGSASVLSYHDVIAGPPVPTIGSVVQAQFTVTQPGTYSLAANDFNFPVPLAAGTLTVIVLNDCSASPSPNCTQVVLSNAAGAGLGMNMLPAGTYDLYAYAQADATAQAGLYSIVVTGGGTPVTPYSTIVPVGQLPAGTSFSVAASVPVSLTLADLGAGMSPPQGLTALPSLKAIVVEGASVLLPTVSGASGGPHAFTPGSTGTAQLFVAAVPPAGGEGAWAAWASTGSGAGLSTLADVAEPVVDASHFGYGFSAPTLAVGTYTMAVKDFGTPAPLRGQTSFVVQHSVVLATIAATNPASVDLPFTATAVGVNLMVFPALQAVNPTDALFGVAVEPASGPNPFQATQAVGALFSAIPMTLGAGNYGVTLADLGFPAAFGSLELVATLGNTEVGAVTTGGAGQSGTIPLSGAGTYTLNVLAQVGAGVHYGLYGLQAGLVPTVT
ncbi:MAG TPA: hypothetical protein VN859_06025, partial [Steroidobacteraceae bacterium]|nr:hypothetical protein [Steroidobacteraceae bacterium]